VPTIRSDPEPRRHRGRDVVFAGLKRHPDYLVRTIDLHGSGRHEGDRFELAGTITSLSTQPSLNDRPTLVKLVGRGSVELDLQAALECTGAAPADRFSMRFSAARRKALQLGQVESLALTLAEGSDEIAADLTLRESELTGTIRVTMHGRELQVAMAGKQTSSLLAESFNASLAEVDRIEATLHLSGSLTSPMVRLESELGSQVLAAVQSAASQVVAVHRKEMEDTLRQQVQSTLDEVDLLVDRRRRQLEQRLSEQQTTLIRLAADTFGFGDRPTIRLSVSDKSGSSSTSDTTFQR
jgi:uncharacterized protein (TIGR03545 family)